MFYKVFLSMFLISTMTFIMWMMFTIKITNTDYKMEPVKFRRYLEARASAVMTTDRPTVNLDYNAIHQKGVTRIANDLKREFSSKY